MALLLVIQISYSFLWLAIWFVEKLLTDRVTNIISDGDSSNKALSFAIIFFNLLEFILEALLYSCLFYVMKQLGTFLDAIQK